ncbi:MAG: HD domain-containing protein [Flavobacteriales bacterium]|nr:HD domain-containing protein [Flavobacteriales bacterium]
MTGLITKIEEIVRERFANDSTGHDWWHIDRVRKNALRLASAESADPEVTELAALLHDIADHKFHGGDLSVGPATAKALLDELGCEQHIISQVVTIVTEVSFKGAGVETAVSSKEAACVQDADRLDAIGAIGVARAFAYGGKNDRLLYHPDHKPTLHADFHSYYNDKGHTINHFYEKLLLLKDRMQTASGKAEAESRHQFMKQFLDEFYREWG